MRPRTYEKYADGVIFGASTPIASVDDSPVVAAARFSQRAVSFSGTIYENRRSLPLMQQSG